MRYSLYEIADITSGKIVSSSGDSIINNIVFDSRNYFYPSHSFFIAIKTAGNDGHFFIQEAFQKGIRNFLIDNADFVSSLPAQLVNSSSIVLVSNTLGALQTLASDFRNKYAGKIIGITGSNGKTTVKEWLFQLLGGNAFVYRSPKSFNSQLGVPLSVLGIGSQETTIIEAGISQGDEMALLEKIIKPNHGIFTNIGQAHQAGFTSLKEKVNEKLLLFKNTQKIFYCADHAEIKEALEEKLKQGFFNFPDNSFVNWSKTENATLSGLKIVSQKRHTVLSAFYQNHKLTLKFPFTDSASIENITFCWLYLLDAGFYQEEIQRRVSTLSPVEMRLELKEGINGCTIINDTYNSDLNSLQIAIDFLSHQNQSRKRTVILSDLLQSGLKNNELYQQVGQLLASPKINQVICIGKNMAGFKDSFPKNTLFYADVPSFLTHFDLSSFRNESLLIKGARKFGLEQIAARLEKKIHQTVLEINLNSLVHNLGVLRSKLSPSTKVMAMVKAFSYGSGSFEIAGILQYHHVDYLAVAYPDEGIALRENGIHLPVMVMSPAVNEFEYLYSYHLEPEIYNFRMLDAVIHDHKIKNRYGKLKIHVKIDTGMHRLGFEEQDLTKLATRLQENDFLQVASLFSHLTSADYPQHDSFTEAQISLFNSCYNSLANSLGYKPLKHILNTAGILRFPQAQFDMVRPGLGLYGIDGTGLVSKQLENVSTLKSFITQVKKLENSQTVGYMRNGKLSMPSKIATIEIGYADGLPRLLGNGKGKVFVNGKLAPITGNICMDMTMIDITGIDASEGDEVIIFGKENSVEKLAEAANTIPYEILSNISARVKRVYFKE